MTNTKAWNGRGRALKRNGQARPPHYTPRSGDRLIDAATAATSGNWSALGGCTISTQTLSHQKDGTVSCVRFVGTAPNTSIFFRCTNINQNISQYDGLEFDLYVTPSTFALWSNTGNYLTVWVGDAAFANTAGLLLQVTCQGWQKIKIPKEAILTIGGSGSWANTTIGEIRFKLQGKASYTCDVSIRNLAFMSWNKPAIAIRFDDIGSSVYSTAFPILRAKGLVGSNAVIGSAIGASAFGGYARCTAAQLREMNAAGWDCVNHSMSHGASPFLTSGSVATCYSEIDACRTAMINNGLGDTRIYCSPYGEWTSDYLTASASALQRAFFGTVGDDTSMTHLAISDEILNPQQLTVLYVTNTVTSAQVVTQVDNWIAGGCCGVILFHHITAVASATIHWSTDNLTALANALQARRTKFDSVNLSQLCNRCLV